jgi:hypothetical protein
MAGGIASFPSGVQLGNGRAAAVITTNGRVFTSMGAVMLTTDVVLFGAPSGTWLFANQRVFINGVPTIGQTSVGIGTLPGGIPVADGTMIVVQTDGRVFGM